ncbi:MAG: hypothetical protein R2932_28635 [Caldilineaceae bacterium]
MTTPIHFSQIDIDQEIAGRLQRISDELAQLRTTGELKIKITSSTLFYLEALGYLVDLTTGMVTREVQPACQNAATETT